MRTQWAGWKCGSLAVGAVAVLASLPIVLPEHAITVITLVLFSCYLAQCWNLAAGYAGQLALGQTLFLAVGAYTSSILSAKYGITPWLGMWVGACIAACAGAALSAIAFRYRIKGIFFALVTLASAEVCRGLFLQWDFVGRSSGVYLTLTGSLSSMTFFTRTPYYAIIVTMVIMCGALTWRLSRSKFGQYLMALREDEAAAEASGVPTFRCKVQIIALSAFLTALGGTFYAQFLLFIAPDMLFNFEHMLGMILGTMVGGAGTILGPVIGSALFSVLSEIFRAIPFANSQEVASILKMIYALVLIIVIIKLPGGLVSLLPGRKRKSR